ncbi:MAG: Rieske (2Fe-2S) protein [Leptospiraceae bacterium]|nr:Rieske (2Fe-2S) protein [Leptospiraceae bacterium]
MPAQVQAIFDEKVYESFPCKPKNLSLICLLQAKRELLLNFLFPGRKKRKKSKIYITSVDEVKQGESYTFVAPGGEKYLLTNTGSGINPYIAFSSRCPHLGCKVHWEDKNNRYFCPCHGGAFDTSGKATEGPPKKAEQSLKALELVIEGGAIYALIETT